MKNKRYSRVEIIVKDNANFKTFIPFRKVFKAEKRLLFLVVVVFVAVLVFERERELFLTKEKKSKYSKLTKGKEVEKFSYLTPLNSLSCEQRFKTSTERSVRDFRQF